jgi:endogenous inhibitor of DNA gyrase (YacG/DUF329 family)
MTDDPDAKVTILKTRCPVCRKPAVLRFRPFCSKRCADIDLARWIGGEYRVETDEKPDGEDPSTSSG